MSRQSRPWVTAVFAGAVALAALAHAQTPGDGMQREDDQGRVALVTGSTDGLGAEVAERLATAGFHVIVHGRNRERGAEVVASIERNGGSARFLRADLADLDEVRQLARTVLDEYDRLDLLINNAGILLGGDERRVSDEGHELTFAVNYLSGFLLTHLLLPRLRESAPARIVNVASLGQAPIDFDDVMLTRGYSGGRAYGQSKLAQIMFTFDLAAELEDSGVTANALHPATFMATNMVESLGIRPRSTVDEGADAVMHVATAQDPGSGMFFDGMRPARANDQAYDADARRRLRELSRRLTGVD